MQTVAIQDLSMTGADGLQTRGMVMQNLEQRLGTGPDVQHYMVGSIANAQSQLDEAKEKLNQLGSVGADMDMPDLKPNTEKSKSILNRLELGSNTQSTKGNSLIPVASDIGLSVGYKVTPKAIAGVGVSYRVGWGHDIRHLSLSHEGVGFRSFVEWKLKGNFWISGRGEMNYRSRFNRFEELHDYNIWQQSILTGISKKYALSKKLKGNLQLMYDLLYYKQVPRTQQIIFRMEYFFK